MSLTSICNLSQRATNQSLRARDLQTWDQPLWSYIPPSKELIIIDEQPDNIFVMRNKPTARETIKNVGVPTVPRSEGLLSSTEEGIKLADEIDFPVMIRTDFALKIGFPSVLL